MQCAECSNSPACNADTYFEKQRFCWEKDVKKWTPTKGRRVCGEACFIGVDANEMGKSLYWNEKNQIHGPRYKIHPCNRKFRHIMRCNVNCNYCHIMHRISINNYTK